MPRPLLSSTFNISYRKIPILAIGRDLYCDTSLIIEALEFYFPPSGGYGTVYPKSSGSEGWAYRSLARGFASFWTDKPLFRTTTGLIPHSVWESKFGADRAQLIGHALDPEKLKTKVPQNLAALDLHLCLLETLFQGREGWVFPTHTPGLPDLALYYQIRWGVDIAAGRGVYDLTGGGARDVGEEVTASVWSEERYPGLWAWFNAFEKYIDSLPDTQSVVAEGDGGWKERMRDAQLWTEECMLVPAAAKPQTRLDEQRGLRKGVLVSVVPDDTGRGDPTVGRLVAIGVEEIVIEPEREGEMKVRVHFPRLGFVIKVVGGERAKL